MHSLPDMAVDDEQSDALEDEDASRQPGDLDHAGKADKTAGQRLMLQPGKQGRLRLKTVVIRVRPSLMVQRGKRPRQRSMMRKAGARSRNVAQRAAACNAFGAAYALQKESEPWAKVAKKHCSRGRTVRAEVARVISERQSSYRSYFAFEEGEGDVERRALLEDGGQVS